MNATPEFCDALYGKPQLIQDANGNRSSSRCRVCGRKQRIPNGPDGGYNPCMAHEGNHSCQSICHEQGAIRLTALLELAERVIAEADTLRGQLMAKEAFFTEAHKYDAVRAAYGQPQLFKPVPPPPEESPGG